MKKYPLLLTALILFSSHDMYLKLDTYFLPPDSRATIQLFNGTFERSDNVIDRDRMADASLVGQGKRIPIDTSQWSEEKEVTLLSLETEATGTWVAGVSTHPRNIAMAAADFNQYLEHDGVLDMLADRQKNNTLDQDAVEKYSKHVKAIFQVGERWTDDWQTRLGYPLEFVPLSNPYKTHAGHQLSVQLLWQGAPLANQLVYVGSQGLAAEHVHSHAEGSAHHHHGEGATHEHGQAQYRTDSDGKITFEITQAGVWYLRTIYLAHSEEEGLTHESNWATLTFGVGEGHTHSHAEGHSHDHDHHHHGEEEPFIPSYVFWIGSLLLVGGLFWWFNRQNS